MSRLALVFLLTATAACRGPAPADMLGSRAAEQEDWFCAPTADNRWQCVQDAELVAKAQSRRLPKQPPKQPPKKAPAPDAVAAPSALPLYQELAYRPGGPVALAALPADFYAVQLLALTSWPELERFVIDNDLQGMAAARIESGGQLRYVLLAAIYRDEATAERAAASLPDNLRLLRPWVRKVGSLQAAMQRADDLFGADL